MNRYCSCVTTCAAGCLNTGATCQQGTDCCNKHCCSNTCCVFGSDSCVTIDGAPQCCKTASEAATALSECCPGLSYADAYCCLAAGAPTKGIDVPFSERLVAAAPSTPLRRANPAVCLTVWNQERLALALTLCAAAVSNAGDPALHQQHAPASTASCRQSPTSVTVIAPKTRP